MNRYTTGQGTSLSTKLIDLLISKLEGANRTSPEKGFEWNNIGSFTP